MQQLVIVVRVLSSVVGSPPIVAQQRSVVVFRRRHLSVLYVFSWSPPAKVTNWLYIFQNSFLFRIGSFIYDYWACPLFGVLIGSVITKHIPDKLNLFFLLLISIIPKTWSKLYHTSAFFFQINNLINVLKRADDSDNDENRSHSYFSHKKCRPKQANKAQSNSKALTIALRANSRVWTNTRPRRAWENTGRVVELADAGRGRAGAWPCLDYGPIDLNNWRVCIDIFHCILPAIC